MAEISERVFRELVLKTLDAALDEDCWPELLRSLAAACGGMGSLVAGCSFAHPNKGLLINGGLDPDIGQLFVQRYQGNLWAQASLAMRPECGAFDIASLVDPRAVRATEFYADVLAPQGIDTMTPMALPLGSGFDTAGVSIGFDGRDDGAPRASVALLNRMAPYLRRAIKINLKLQAVHGRAKGLEAALDGMPGAALLASQSARVLFANCRAEDLLAQADGLAVRDGALLASRPGDTRALHRMIGAAGRAADGLLPNGPDSLSLARPSGRPALSVLVAPVGELRAELSLQDKPAALLIVTDPQERAGPPAQAVERLGKLFGLTRTEARVAVHIALGMSGPEAAAQLGIGQGTVHAHLKSIFAKTGVRRQSGLARLLTRTGVLDLN